MKSIILGGCGFIGYHLVQKLLNEKLRPIPIFDHNASTAKLASRPTKLASLSRSIQLSTIGGKSIHYYPIRIENIEPEDFFNSTFGDDDDIVIVHLANMSTVNAVATAPLDAVINFSEGTQRVLDAALACNAKRFIYLSSSMVYGEFTQTPMPETAQANPTTLYGVLKYSAELLVKHFCKQHNIECLIIRPTAVYGPMDNAGRIINNYIKSALDGEQINVFNPDFKLDFTDVSDVVNGIWLGMTASSQTISKIPENTVNISNGIGYSIEYAARKISELATSSTVPVKIITPPNDSDVIPKRGALDISAAREYLGYRPRIDFDQGIAQLIDFWKSNYQK